MNNLYFIKDYPNVVNLYDSSYDKWLVNLA